MGRPLVPKARKMALDCRCKVAKCSVCFACARCGCSHDGKSVEEKMNRARGKPKGNKNAEKLGFKLRQEKSWG